MTKIASIAAAAAIVATSALAAPAAQAGPYFHYHHHGYWAGPVIGGLALAAAATAPVTTGCYTVKRKVYVPGGVAIRRTLVCG